MPDPVMPFGVEHSIPAGKRMADKAVPDPVMPFGVEHDPATSDLWLVD